MGEGEVKAKGKGKKSRRPRALRMMVAAVDDLFDMGCSLAGDGCVMEDGSITILLCQPTAWRGVHQAPSQAAWLALLPLVSKRRQAGCWLALRTLDSDGQPGTLFPLAACSLLQPTIGYEYVLEYTEPHVGKNNTTCTTSSTQAEN